MRELIDESTKDIFKSKYYIRLENYDSWKCNHSLSNRMYFVAKHFVSENCYLPSLTTYGKNAIFLEWLIDSMFITITLHDDRIGSVRCFNELAPQTDSNFIISFGTAYSNIRRILPILRRNISEKRSIKLFFLDQSKDKVELL